MADTPTPSDLETDPRFPSGKWLGFFLQPALPPGRHEMELLLTFRQGQLTGEGRDCVGRFHVRGTYELAGGRCEWIKQYIGRHAVHYRGFNEGKGIWGTWEIIGEVVPSRGGFHIWPEGMPDPTKPHLSEEAELPLPKRKRRRVRELVAR
ncbi:MAG: hypothetical protein RMI91_03890 [Gemmatales bacterium]|nr:hypothetical protein [Gemmatales bacterium]MDW7993774.1 hypothetical protein [Gemmatales bacterium]